MVDGRSQGYVMCRSPHFMVWSEVAKEVHVQGRKLPWECVTELWEGPRGAAISEDEEWCVVIGLGFIAFRLRPDAEMRSHWRYPVHARWQLHLPMKGDLAGAVLFTGVRALDAHRFALETIWDSGTAGRAGSGFTTPTRTRWASLMTPSTLSAKRSPSGPRCRRTSPVNLNSRRFFAMIVRKTRPREA